MQWWARAADFITYRSALLVAGVFRLRLQVIARYRDFLLDIAIAVSATTVELYLDKLRSLRAGTSSSCGSSSYEGCPFLPPRLHAPRVSHS